MKTKEERKRVLDEFFEKAHRTYDQAEQSQTIYSRLISEYVLTFVSEEDVDVKLKWDTFHRIGFWNPTMQDIVLLEEMFDFRLIDMLNWGKQMGYEI